MKQTITFSSKKIPRPFPKQAMNYYQTDAEHLEKLQANKLISQALQFTNKMNGNIKRYAFRLLKFFFLTSGISSFE